MTSIGGPSESLPMIDFPQLGEARPVDLIDMTLEFPESLKKLNGQRVSMVGFMAPLTASKICAVVRWCQVTWV